MNVKICMLGQQCKSYLDIDTGTVLLMDFIKTTLHFKLTKCFTTTVILIYGCNDIFVVLRVLSFHLIPNFIGLSILHQSNKQITVITSLNKYVHFLSSFQLCLHII